jgi:hypothetical protein
LPTAIPKESPVILFLFLYFFCLDSFSLTLIKTTPWLSAKKRGKRNREKNWIVGTEGKKMDLGKKK